MMMEVKDLPFGCKGVLLKIQPRYINNPYEPRFIMPGHMAFLTTIRTGTKLIFLIHKDEPKTLGVLCGWLQGIGSQYLYAEAGIGEHHVVGVNIRNNRDFGTFISLAFEELL